MRPRRDRTSLIAELVHEDKEYFQRILERSDKDQGPKEKDTEDASTAATIRIEESTIKNQQNLQTLKSNKIFDPKY